MADYRGGFMVLDGHRGTDFVIRDLAHMEEGVPVHTPAHDPVLISGENPYIWYKVVGMARGDELHTMLVYPNGAEERLYTFTADQDYRYVYRYVYGPPLPPGNIRDQVVY